LGLDRSDPEAQDDITTINQLTLPVNENILVYLTSKDVIHSFGIPLLRVKQDAIPGQSIRVWFRPTMTNDEIRENLARHHTISGDEIPEGLIFSIAMDDYQASDGSLILERGDYVTEEAIQQLTAEGVLEVHATPDTPMEIACAQLCGLGHYRMRGTVTILSGEEYEDWLAEEAEYLEW
jgi:cytochrome c oxidase subunit 2